MIFYRDVSDAGFDIAPDQAMQSLHRVLRNFKMPGYTVPEFRRKAVIIAVGGVYDPRIHLDDVVHAGAQEVAHLRTRGLHRRGRADA